MGMGLNIELVSEYPTQEVEVVCSQCGSTLRLTRYARHEELRVPEYGETEQYCPVCAISLGLGLSVEIIAAQPWPPDEEPPKPPIAGIPEWLGKHWPALVIGGLGFSILAVFGLKKRGSK